MKQKLKNLLTLMEDISSEQYDIANLSTTLQNAMDLCVMSSDDALHLKTIIDIINKKNDQHANKLDNLYGELIRFEDSFNSK